MLNLMILCTMNMCECTLRSFRCMERGNADLMNWSTDATGSHAVGSEQSEVIVWSPWNLVGQGEVLRVSQKRTPKVSLAPCPLMWLGIWPGYVKPKPPTQLNQLITLSSHPSEEILILGSQEGGSIFGRIEYYVTMSKLCPFISGQFWLSSNFPCWLIWIQTTSNGPRISPFPISTNISQFSNFLPKSWC